MPPINGSEDGITFEDLKKITSYYSLGVPAILGTSLAVLRGKRLKINERLCLTYLGGISGLLDDLFDDPLNNVDHLESFILHPEFLIPTNGHERLLSNMYKKGLSYAYHPESLKAQASVVFKAQQQSLQQKKIFISEEMIGGVTLTKGGSSFVFYRLCMNHILGPEEKELLYHLGGLMQLGNDIFDVWEDFHEGTVTSVTRCRHIPKLREIFYNELKKTYSLAIKTPYSPALIRKFLRIIILALSRVFVCLDQFYALQRNTGDIFSIEKYERKELICDMQKPVNQLKAVNYFLKISSSINVKDF